MVDLHFAVQTVTTSRQWFVSNGQTTKLMKINILLLIAAQAALFSCKEEATSEAENDQHDKALSALTENEASPVGQWNWKSTCGGVAPGCEYASETLHKKIEFTGALFTGVVGGTAYKNVPYTTDSTRTDPTPTYFITLENGAHWQVSFQAESMKIQLGELTEEYAPIP